MKQNSPKGEVLKRQNIFQFFSQEPKYYEYIKSPQDASVFASVSVSASVFVSASASVFAFVSTVVSVFASAPVFSSVFHFLCFRLFPCPCPYLCPRQCNMRPCVRLPLSPCLFQCTRLRLVIFTVIVFKFNTLKFYLIFTIDLTHIFNSTD